MVILVTVRQNEYILLNEDDSIHILMYIYIHFSHDFSQTIITF